MGLRERGSGRTVAKPVPAASAVELHKAIAAHVEVGSTLHTDEAAAYGGIGGLFFKHETINHGAGEYSRDGVTTNGIESVWAVLKRGVYGTFHHVSPKHLGRYVNEFAFRLNEGNVKRMTLARLGSFIAACAGRRITYRALTA